MTPPDAREVRAAIAAAVEHWAPLVRARAEINRAAMLSAICENETSGGDRCWATRHEAGYCYGGPYYRGDGPGGRPGDDLLRRLTVAWGCLAHESFGPWQVLYITAYERGFRDDPIRLRDPMTSCEYVVKILNHRLFDRLPDATVEKALDTWNSGNPFDANVPVGYVEEGMKHYRGAIA